MNVELFAYRYPQMVSALVLAEAQHEDELARLDRVSGGKLSGLNGSILENYRQCTEAAHAAFEPPARGFSECVGGPYPFAKGSFAMAYTAQFKSPAYWDAATSELVNLHTVSSDQLREARKSFGNLPFACLIRTVSRYTAPGTTQTALSKAAERENAKMQSEVAALSRRGACKIVAGAGHDIGVDRPQAVIEAISEVLREQAR